MASDDIVGLLVAAALRERLDEDMDVVELGANPTALVDNLPGRSALIIVDAVWSDEPGHLVDIDWFDPDRPELESEIPISSHAVSITDQVRHGGGSAL